MPELTRNGPLWTIDFGDDENRYSPEFLTELDSLLDQVAAADEPVALITTGSGKFYSNGLDLKYLGAHPDRLWPYVAQVHGILAKMLTLPVPTVAALNGHTFGAGALLAVAHDYRVMRTDRGYFCFPEVDIQIPFSEGMSRLVQAKTSARTAMDAMTTGRRYPAEDALAAGLVDAVAGLDELTDRAAGLVAPFAGKHRPTLGTIKATMFAEVTDALSRTEG